MRSVESFQEANVAAGTYGPFAVTGGYYQFGVKSTFGGGSVQLNQLGPDGTTYLANGASITANGFQYVYLPPGQVEVVVTTATASYFALTRVPLSD